MVAQRRKQLGSERPDPSESRLTGPTAGRNSKVDKKTSAAALSEAESEGWTLLADPNWASGYTGVLVDKSTAGLRNRFRVQMRTADGRRVTIGELQRQRLGLTLTPRV